MGEVDEERRGGGDAGRAARRPDRRVPDPTGSGGDEPRVLDATFRTREVVDLLGLSRRQLQYWAKTGLVEPSERTAGGHHRYRFDDLVALKATKRLIDAGISVQKIRKSVQALQSLLPRVDRPLSELVLVATGDVVLAFHEDTVFEAISGQEWVFEVAGFEREVAAYCRGDRETSRRRDRETASGRGAERGAEADWPARPAPRGARRSSRRIRHVG